MAGLKLILPLFLMSALTFSMANAGPADLINAMIDPKADPVPVGPNLPKALQDMLPTSIMEKLNALTTKDIKDAFKKLMDLLKDVLNGKIPSLEEFMKKLKEISPKINDLLKDAKDQVVAALKKLVAGGGRRKRELSQPAKDLVQKVIDILDPPPPNPLQQLLDAAKDAAKKLLDKIDPPPPRPKLQDLVDALAKAFPTLKPLLSSDIVTSLLGTNPPK